MTSTGERCSAFADPAFPDGTAICSIKMPLDYAMAEGSELGFPMLVGLSRRASPDECGAGASASICRSRYFHQAERAVS